MPDRSQARELTTHPLIMNKRILTLSLATVTVLLGTSATAAPLEATPTSAKQPSLQTVATQMLEEFDIDAQSGLSRSEFLKAIKSAHGGRFTLPEESTEQVPVPAGKATESLAEDEADLHLLACFSVADANDDETLTFIELVDALRTLQQDRQRAAS